MERDLTAVSLPPPMIPGKQLARHLNVHYYTVLRWAASKKIPSCRLSKRALRFDLSQVLAALERDESAAEESAA